MDNKLSENFKCGMVSIVGRPNVGKSTLLNRILEEKVAIVSRIPQTTRNKVRGMYNEDRGQIIFIDTPGIHVGKDKLDKFMNKSSSSTMRETDCVIYLVDSTRQIGNEEMIIADKVKKLRCPVILGLNKIDQKKANIDDYIKFWEEVKGESLNTMKNFTLMPMSGKKGINLEALLNVLFEYMPQGQPLYPTDIICDVPIKMAVADIIREKLFRNMKNEIPHSIGVVIEEIKPLKKKKTTEVKVLILVERKTQKEIVIGKDGQVLKKIGTSARVELEDLLETKIYLNFFVKVHKGWRDDNYLLQEIGHDPSSI